MLTDSSCTCRGQDLIIWVTTEPLHRILETKIRLCNNLKDIDSKQDEGRHQKELSEELFCRADGKTKNLVYMVKTKNVGWDQESPWIWTGTAERYEEERERNTPICYL